MLCLCEKLTQVFFYPEGLMTYMKDPEFHSVSVRLPDNQRDRISITVGVEESTALITFRKL